MLSLGITPDGILAFPARVVRFTRLDGTVLRIAEAEKALTIDGETFEPLVGCEIGQVRKILGGDVGSVAINFAHYVDGPIDTFDLSAALWDGAEFEMYIVDRFTLDTLGDLHFYGTVQPVSFDPITGRGSFDVRGPAAQAESVIETRQTMCRANVFDEFCTLNAASYAISATVVSVDDNYNATLSIGAPPATGYLDQGTGVVDDTGLPFEIARWDATSNRMQLRLPRCYLFAAGYTLTLYPGCPKTPEACRTRFGVNNKINYKGDDHVLGSAAIVAG